MTIKLSEARVRDLHKIYVSGKTSVDLGRMVGVHSSAIRTRFKKLGLLVRDGSASMTLRMGQTSKRERLKITKAAHDAVRGMRHTRRQLANRALGVEAKPPRMSSAERQFSELLAAEGLNFKFQKALGTYNLDFAVEGCVSVEIFGGRWHGTGRHRARFQKRTRYLLNNGWHQVIVWVAGRKPNCFPSALSYVKTLLDVTRRLPADVRQNLVVWCDGQVFPGGHAKSHHFTMKPAFKKLRDPVTGRYNYVTD